MDLNKTGKTIARLRKSMGFTQASLAEKLGISDKAVSKWERGLSCPDASLWNKLSILLDTDIESLMYGYTVGDNWIGILILDDAVSGDTLVYDKPLINYLISQFLLAGIKEIYIVGECEIPQLPNIRIIFIDKLDHQFTENAFVIYGNWFVYGANLTKHFTRAMSSGKLTVLALICKKGDYPISINEERVGNLLSGCDNVHYFVIPYAFLPKGTKIDNFQSIVNKTFNVEVLERGMIGFEVNTYGNLLNLSQFIYIMQNNTGEKIADLDEIIRNRDL